MLLETADGNCLGALGVVILWSDKVLSLRLVFV